jgi:hypothetical protein
VKSHEKTDAEIDYCSRKQIGQQVTKVTTASFENLKAHSGRGTKTRVRYDDKKRQ